MASKKDWIIGKSKLLLIAILFLGGVLRIAGLDKVPPEPFGDELDVGYHAYSLLETGRDYYGQLFPTYIHSFSEWRTPLLMYATAPFIGVFGLNEYGLRLPNAVFGILSIFLLYLLVNRTLKSQKIALFAAFLLAVSPWHLQYSRAAFEVSLLLSLLLSGAILFLAGLKKHWLLYLSVIFFALSFYTYSTANVFTPLLLGLLIVVNKEKVLALPRKKALSSFLLFILLSLPVAYHIFFGSAADRFSKFSVFSDTQIVDDINRRRELVGNTPLERLLHNKPISWSRKIAGNYAMAFSPQFLFINGDTTLRHSVQEIGELYWIQLPLLLLGVLWALRRKDRWSYFWLGWLLLAPIPASLTRDGAYHATRLILMLPALSVLTAAGAREVLESRGRTAKKVLFAGMALLFVIEFGLYLHRYWVHYPKESWRWWQTGYKEAMLYMKEKENDYEIIAFNNSYEPALPRFLFWWRYPPNKFHQEFQRDREVSGILPGFSGFSLEGRYYFGMTNQDGGGVQEFIKPNILYLVSQRDEVGGDWDWSKDPPAGIKVLLTTRNPFGEPIFYVVTTER